MTRLGRTLSFLGDPDEDPDAPLRALALDGGGRETSPLAAAQAVNDYYAKSVPQQTPAPLTEDEPATAATTPPPAAASLPDMPPRAPLTVPDYEPPERSKSKGLFGDEGAAWAALLDVFVNKGRGTPQIIAAASQLPEQRRRNQIEEDYKIAQINAMNRRGIEDPEEKELRRLRLEQAQTRLEQQAKQMEATAGEYLRRKQETEAKYGAGSPQVQQLAEMYRQLGVPEKILGVVEGMSMDTVRATAPTIRQQSDLAQSPRLAAAAANKAAAVADATADVRHAHAGQVAQDAANQAGAVYASTIPYARDKARETAAGTQEGQGDYKERRMRYEQSRNYVKDFGDELDIAGLMTDVEHAGGAVPESIAERFRNTITARGIDPKRLTAWQARQLILEKWARSQSGAAISNSEEGRFVSQVGLNPTASAEQINAAFNVLSGLVQRRLRGGAVNNPAAMDVLRQSGTVDDPESYLGMTTEEASANAKQVVAPPPARESVRQTAVAQEPPPPAPPRARGKKPKASEDRLRRLGI